MRQAFVVMGGAMLVVLVLISYLGITAAPGVIAGKDSRVLPASMSESAWSGQHEAVDFHPWQRRSQSRCFLALWWPAVGSRCHGPILWTGPWRKSSSSCIGIKEGPELKPRTFRWDNHVLGARLGPSGGS